MDHLSANILRVAMLLNFPVIGLQKFTAYEAKAIEPFVANSPFFSWAHNLFGLRATSGGIGVLELAISLGLVVGLFAPGSLLSLFGAAGVAALAAVTLTFVFTTPGVILWSEGLPVISAYPGQFLMKDMVLLAAPIFLVREAMAARASGERQTGYSGALAPQVR